MSGWRPCCRPSLVGGWGCWSATWLPASCVHAFWGARHPQLAPALTLSHFFTTTSPAGRGVWDLGDDPAASAALKLIGNSWIVSQIEVASQCLALGEANGIQCMCGCRGSAGSWLCPADQNSCSFTSPSSSLLPPYVCARSQPHRAHAGHLPQVPHSAGLRAAHRGGRLLHRGALAVGCWVLGAALSRQLLPRAASTCHGSPVTLCAKPD